MALKIKAKEKKLKFSKDGPEVYRYVMVPDLYSTLDQDKVIKEAAIRSGVSEGVMQACWKGAGEVIKAWATEGHSVALPGLGNMRFGLSAKAVEDVNDVKSSLIRTRRIVFTPTVALKEELANTAINITCYDRNGDVVKRVTSSDPGTVEESDQGDDNGTGNSSSQEPSQTTDFALTISKSGTGTSTVKDANNQVIESGASLASGTSVNIAIVPAEGKIPTATINGTSIQLTESEGTYTGSFEMPAQASTLAINSGSAGGGNDDDDLIQN